MNDTEQGEKDDRQAERVRERLGHFSERWCVRWVESDILDGAGNNEIKIMWNGSRRRETSGKAKRPLNDIPELFQSAAELSASNASTQGIIADTYLVVDICIGKVVLAAGHCANEYGDVVCRGQRWQVF